MQYHPGAVVHKQEALRERVRVFLSASGQCIENCAQFMGELQGLKVGSKLDRPPTGLEPNGEFRARTGAWWKEQILDYVTNASSDGPADVLVVTHGGFIDCLTRVLLSVERGAISNASITVVEVERESLKAVFIKYCDISHLAGPVVQVNVDLVADWENSAA